LRLCLLRSEADFLARVPIEIGRRTVLGFESREDRHLGRSQLFGGLEFIEREIVSRTDLLLDGALHIGERERRITPAGPGQRVLQEPEPVFVTGEPGLIELMLVIVRIMRCTA